MMMGPENIEVITSVEAIRKRPGMYVGSTGVSGLLHIVWELIANSVDQVLAGHASTIEVALYRDGAFEISDDGIGIDLTDSKILTYFTEAHRGSTADGHTPHIHIATIGSGLAAVNALSSRFIVTSTFEGATRRCAWTRGVADGSVEETSQISRGTSIRLWPDSKIFKSTVFPMAEIAKALDEIEALLPELSVSFTAQKQSGSWEKGLKVLLFSQNKNVSEPIISARTSLSDSSVPAAELAIACSWSKSGNENIVAYCNFLKVAEPCKFISQIRSSFWELLGSSDDEHSPLKGLTLVASLTMLSPEFSGPSRSQVDDSRAVEITKQLISTQIAATLQEKTTTDGSPILATWKAHLSN